MKFIGYCPLATLLWFGRRIGDIFFYVSHRRARISQTNIALSFPELNPSQQKKLVHSHLQSLGMGIMESLYTWSAPQAKIKARGNVLGLEHLPKDKGAILILSHFTSLEIGCCILGMHRPVSALFKKQGIQKLNTAMLKGRARFMDESIFKDDIKTMIKALRNKQHILYAADQHTNSGDWMFVDFFGIPAATRTSTSRLAKMTQADVLPLTIKRLPDYHYQITIHPKLENFGDNAATDTQAIMTLAEEDARDMPEQYFWAHQRFKSHPDGTKNRYI